MKYGSMRIQTFCQLVAVALMVVVCILPVACHDEEEGAQNNRIGVVVTILPQADFAEKIGGRYVEVTVMIPPGASPHAYEPVPSQLKAAAEANIYFKVGSGVDFEIVWMDKLLQQNRDLQVYDCSQGITKLGNDEHIWNSPVNAKKMSENICSGLVEVDPSHSDYYEQNRDAYLRDLDDLDKYIHERLDDYDNRYFMIYHPAFAYFAAEYGLTQLAIEHEGKPPTPKVVKQGIDSAMEHNLSYVFVAPQFSDHNARSIADAIGGQTIDANPLPSDYLQNMKDFTEALALELE